MKAKFTLSKSKVLEQYNKVKEFADIVSYSSKTNQIVTGILEKNTDAMFSVHLVNELKNNKDRSRVLFLAQAWNVDLIQELYDSGIRWFAVDNESDLDVMETFLERDVKVNLLLRLKLRENTIRTEKFFVFGMTSEVISARIMKLKESGKIGELGIHFHRKTQNMAEWNYKYELERLFSEDILSAITVVNMGGGLPSEYANTNVNVLQSIFRRITEFREWLASKNVRLVLEPGRFIAAPAGKLHTKIIAIHDNNIIVNASVYNSDMDALIVPVKLLIKGELQKGKGYVVKGITPCSLDLFRYRVYLDNPCVGNSLVFLNAGAYNFTTDFCDLEKIDTEIIE